MSDRPLSIVNEDSLIYMCDEARKLPAGCLVEVGVYKGGSAWHLAKVAREQDRDLHLFDTFAGIPCKKDIDTHVIGDFGDTDLETVRAQLPDAIFHVGNFPETLPDDLRDIAFVHADCDQYESVKAVCEHLYPRLIKGGIIVFDDYYALAGAKAAIDEMFGDRVWVSPFNKVCVTRE